MQTSDTRVTVEVRVRDLQHWKKIASYLDTHVGQGREYWKCNRRIHRDFARGKKNITARVLFDPAKCSEDVKTLGMFLTLM